MWYRLCDVLCYARYGRRKSLIGYYAVSGVGLILSQVIPEQTGKLLLYSKRTLSFIFTYVDINSHFTFIKLTWCGGPILKESQATWNIQPYDVRHLTSHLIMLRSHCRPDQLDRPDLPKCSTKLDQTRPTAWSGLYKTCFRPLLDHARPTHDLSRLLQDFNPTTNPICTRPSQLLHDSYMISVDLISIKVR